MLRLFQVKKNPIPRVNHFFRRTASSRVYQLVVSKSPSLRFHYLPSYRLELLVLIYHLLLWVTGSCRKDYLRPPDPAMSLAKSEPLELALTLLSRWPPHRLAVISPDQIVMALQNCRVGSNPLPCPVVKLQQVLRLSAYESAIDDRHRDPAQDAGASLRWCWRG